MATAPVSLLQFHGDETMEQCCEIAARVNRPFMRALRVGAGYDGRRFARIRASITAPPAACSPACCSMPSSTAMAAVERFSIGLSFQKNSRLGSF